MKNLKKFNELLNEELTPEMVEKNLEELKALWARLNKAKAEYKYAEAFQLHDEITGLEGKLPKGHDDVDHYFLDKEITAALHSGDKAEIEKAKERLKNIKQEAHIEENNTNYQNPDKIRLERTEGKGSEPAYSFILMGKAISLSPEQRENVESSLNK